uniref:C-X-C motif chemokine n=1 Tax=Chrysemys picta bellii TaxID=8478 RepID=A0A8C3HTL5_CHRPI
ESLATDFNEAGMLPTGPVCSYLKPKGVLLLILIGPGLSAPMAGELRCQCLQTETAVIHPKRIAYVELIPEGPHCGVPEVIATTTHGKKVCLDPTARWVKIVINKILNRYVPGVCGCLCCASGPWVQL